MLQKNSRLEAGCLNFASSLVVYTPRIREGLVSKTLLITFRLTRVPLRNPYLRGGLSSPTEWGDEGGEGQDAYGVCKRNLI